VSNALQQGQHSPTRTEAWPGWKAPLRTWQPAQGWQPRSSHWVLAAALGDRGSLDAHFADEESEARKDSGTWQKLQTVKKSSWFRS
jgi:hypothetical protein